LLERDGALGIKRAQEEKFNPMRGFEALENGGAILRRSSGDLGSDDVCLGLGAGARRSCDERAPTQPTLKSEEPNSEHGEQQQIQHQPQRDLQGKRVSDLHRQ
jgi:hypothetical protein